jgi:hypothetical protein
VLQKHYYGRPSFIALQELQRGARTDRELQSVLQPLEQTLDERKSATLLKRFPYWADYPETSEVLRDLFFHSLKGVAINPAPYMKGDRLRKLHHLFASGAIGIDGRLWLRRLVGRSRRRRSGKYRGEGVTPRVGVAELNKCDGFGLACSPLPSIRVRKKPRLEARWTQRDDQDPRPGRALRLCRSAPVRKRGFHLLGSGIDPVLEWSMGTLRPP